MSGSNLVRKNLPVLNRLGLHARAAAQIAALACQYQAEVRLELNGRYADAKNILDILCLGGAQGTIVHLEAQGPEAQEAATAIANLFSRLFGEI